MSKQHGLGLQAYVSGYDLGDDIRDFTTRSPVGVFDFTPITKLAAVRKHGRRDGGLTATAFLDDGGDRAHGRFSPLSSADQLATVAFGSTLGAPAVSQWAKQIGYDPTRAADGMITFAVDHQANGYPNEWGVLLTAGTRTDTGATNGTAVDLGSVSPGAFGAQFHLHVLSFVGTDATIKIQQSSDNGAGDPFADVAGGGFTQITSGPTFQRIATAAIDVERHLRVVTTTSGGFSAMAFVVQGVRNDAAVVI
jgi:hypothetical protein